MRVCVYAIALNEAKNVTAWAESARDADLILLADTGSTDGTADLARAAGVEVVDIRVVPWRFDMARNAALAKIPPDIDWCIVLDLDERLQPGWREAMEQVPEWATRAHLHYTWSWKPDGSPGLQFWRDLTHRREHYYWRNAVHEALTYYGPGKEYAVEVPGAAIHHHQDVTKERREKYLALLQLACREDPMADRLSSWLGREYLYAGRKEEAAAELKRHIDLPTATWDGERAASMHLLSVAEPENRLHWLQMSEQTDPHRREPKVRLAEYYYHVKDWRETLRWAQAAVAITERPFDYLSEDRAWGGLPWELLGIALWHTGEPDKAIAATERAAELDDDPRIQANLKIMRRELVSADEA